MLDGIPSRGSPAHAPHARPAAQEPLGTLFVSIPSLLDPGLSPEGTHLFHAFAPDWVADWAGLEPRAYEAKKESTADAIFKRLEATFPGLASATVYR